MRLGNYEALAEIGRGGAGAVFRARGPDGREVALKVLLKLDAKKLARFDRERRLLASFGGPDGFVPLLDSGDSEHGPFIVMPLLTGGTLRAKLIEGRRTVAETVALGERLAAALARAHEKGIVHRDLKPENVIFDGDARPFVADLGLAKHFDTLALGASRSVTLSRAGELRGTPGYLAPEQMRDSKSVGPQADVFALGAILYECLVGGPAFQADSVVELLAKIDSIEPEPLAAARPDAPRWLVGVIEKCLAKTPEARYRDAGDLLAALGHRIDPKPRRRPSLLWALLAVPALALLLLPWVLGGASAGLDAGRVGAVLVGTSTEGDARRAFGDAARIGTELAVLDTREKLGVLVQNGRVVRIALRATDLRTRGGSGVGSSEAAVAAELGAGLRRERSLVYERLGLAFELSETAPVVERVLVSPAQAAPPDLAHASRVLAPGKGLDRIVVGQSKLEDLHAVFGRDGLLVEEKGVTRFVFFPPADPRRPTRCTLRDGVLVDLSVSGLAPTELRTEGGVTLGAARLTVKKELGDPDGETLRSSGWTWFYDVLGVAVSFDAKDRVIDVTIFPSERPERLVATPGQGVLGLVADRSTLADVRRLVGDDGKARTEDRLLRVDYHSGIEWLDRRRPTSVQLKGDTVAYIVLGPSSGGLATREGIRIGSPRDALERAYGKPFGSFEDRGRTLHGETLYWPDRGLNAHINDRLAEVDELSITSAAKRR